MTRVRVKVRLYPIFSSLIYFEASSSKPCRQVIRAVISAIIRTYVKFIWFKYRLPSHFYASYESASLVEDPELKVFRIDDNMYLAFYRNLERDCLDVRVLGNLVIYINTMDVDAYGYILQVDSDSFIGDVVYNLVGNNIKKWKTKIKIMPKSSK